jgi:hypothetical protein
MSKVHTAQFERYKAKNRNCFEEITEIQQSRKDEF